LFARKRAVKIGHDDGFRKDEDDLDAANVEWQGENTAYGQCVFYLHGALHLFDTGPHLQKYTWVNTGQALIDQAVANSLLHVGISFLPVTLLELTVQPLLEEPVVLCMKAGHALATKPEIRPEDLDGQPVIAVARQILPAMHEEIAGFFSGFGLELNVVADAYTPLEALSLVEQQVGVCFLCRSLATLGRNIVTKPLFTNVLTRKCGIFYREENVHPLVRKFVALVSERTAQARL
jgi:DNA-binding transcriptional LysR family regulator